jgi:hypothetical protein
VIAEQFVFSNAMGETMSHQVLYPSTRDNSALPERVRKRLEAALRV